YTVTYYASSADLANNNPIPAADETAYENTSLAQTIYVRLEGLNGCVSEGQFDLVVNPLPTFTPIASLEKCDSDMSPEDGLTEFDLSNATAQLNTGTGTTVTFYGSQSDADAGIAGTEHPTLYTNATPGETVYVR